VIRIEVGGGKVIIADEGPGIPAEIVADILDFSGCQSISLRITSGQ
jgi:hypothetical protein